MTFSRHPIRGRGGLQTTLRKQLRMIHTALGAPPNGLSSTGVINFGETVNVDSISETGNETMASVLTWCHWVCRIGERTATQGAAKLVCSCTRGRDSLKAPLYFPSIPLWDAAFCLGRRCAARLTRFLNRSFSLSRDLVLLSTPLSGTVKAATTFFNRSQRDETRFV